MTARKGFTLIELLVVIAIIAILAAILFPIFVQAQQSARTCKCQNNVKQLCMGAGLYEADNVGGIMPGCVKSQDPANPGIWSDKMWMRLINPYLKQLHGPTSTAYNMSGVYFCPNMPWSTSKNTATGFAIGTPLPDDLKRCYGYNYSYLGGHVKADGTLTSRQQGELVKATRTIRFLEIWNWAYKANNYWSEGRGTAYCYGPVTDSLCIPSSCWPPGSHASRSVVGWMDGHVTAVKIAPPFSAQAAAYTGIMQKYHNDTRVVMDSTDPIEGDNRDPYFRLSNPKP